MAARVRSHDLARLFDRLPEPVYVVDDQRRIVFFNQAAAEWTGFEADEMLGLEGRYHASPDLVGPARVACNLCPPPEVFAGEETTVEVACLTRGGEPMSRLVRFLPLRAGADEVLGVLALALGEATADEPPSEPALSDLAIEPSADELHLEVQRLRQRFRERYHIDRVLGDTPAMVRVRAQIALAVRSAASVLIVGPSGSGREHIARAIHYSHALRDKDPLVPLACSLVGAELLRSTISAMLRMAPETGQRSTLLLNDVDSLPPELQRELPELLASHEGRLRVISTSREPLTALAARQQFSPLAANVLSTLSIELPPLVERLEDLPLLAQLFLEQANARGSKQVGRFSEEALDELSAYPWRRDLDELEELVRQAHASTSTAEIKAADLPERVRLAADAAAYARRPEETIQLEEFLAGIEQELIERALAQAKGNKTKAAQMLGMTRPKFYRRLEQLGLMEEGAGEEGEKRREGEGETGR